MCLRPIQPGGFISVAVPGKAGSVTLKIGQPAENGTFQWVDMQRGDIMLMSLATHRYLLAQPGTPGPISADHPGPRPDRKDGSCFTWASARADSGLAHSEGLSPQPCQNGASGYTGFT